VTRVLGVPQEERIAELGRAAGCQPASAQ
jgi:hypothetical protein